MAVELKHISPTGDMGHTYQNTAFEGDERNGKNKDVDTGPPEGFRNRGFTEEDSGPNDVVFTIEKDKPHWEPHPDADSDKKDPALEDEEPGFCLRKLQSFQKTLSDFYVEHKQFFKYAFLFLLAIAYACYFGYAMYYQFGDEGSIRLLWITCVVVLCLVIALLMEFCGGRIKESTSGCRHTLSPHSDRIAWIVVSLIFAAIILFIIIDVAAVSKTPYNLVSGIGLLVYVLLFFIFSHNPAKVRWRPVAWGLALQFVFALLILRWKGGYDAFKWLGDRVSEFLAHTDAGSIFVFGEKYTDHFFAFKVLPTVVFFSTAISVLYYLGVMQVLIRKISWVMQVTMGTTAGESLNAAGNIFIGQSEAPLLIRPLIQHMTRSELHAVMTGGFSTIAGTVLAAYISFGVPANHLLSASVMSAPAALAMAKLFYPETHKSKTTSKDVANMEKSPERGVIEAASAGASASIKLVANIAVNLIAFIAMLAFINATLSWFGARVGLEPSNGYPYLTFQLICSYLLWPFALVMGVDVRDCRKVAELIGIKTFLNEFVAFDELGKLIKNKATAMAALADNGTYTFTGDDVTVYVNGTTSVLAGGFLTERSEVISTYALCGFANLGSIGIVLGALGAMAPNRRRDLASVAVRAMIAGNVACFMTACIAGLLYQPEKNLGFTSR